MSVGVGVWKRERGVCVCVCEREREGCVSGKRKKKWWEIIDREKKL